ncbi:hypothetical protein VRB69_13370 [Erwinia aphidicola]|uniref:hypothetical protein n=1 Tax=Erwinia aphidicola TaxID=68334 RepID=UPI0030CDC1A9
MPPGTVAQNEISDGSQVNVALEVVGLLTRRQQAKIVSSAGEVSKVNGRGLALVGRCLDNSDEITSTLSNGAIIVGRRRSTAGFPSSHE